MRQPCRKVEQLGAADVERLKEMLERSVRPSLKADVSSYARGRTRCWLQREMPLGPTQRERPGLKVPDLWAALSAIWMRHLPGRPETGLASRGEIGITPHRDASYARPVTMSVNLGRAKWFHDPRRNGATKGRVVGPHEWQVLAGGEVLVFDSKHPHAAQPLEPDRWVVILWQVK